MYVVNRTRGTYLGVDVRVANSARKRMIGLYAHRDLQYGDGAWLVPCNSIQTIGMRHVIDVIFLDREDRVVRILSRVGPGRVILPVRRARSVLEVPTGVVESSETQLGDHIELVEEAVLTQMEQTARPAAGAAAPVAGK